MKIILIAAITLDGYIARNANEKITWSKDLSLFKKQTMGNALIIGSNTYNSIDTSLNGRKTIVAHRTDNPKDIIENIESKYSRCFIGGGGMTNYRFSKYLTHVYLTPHPLIFNSGIKLFAKKTHEIKIKLEKKIIVNEEENIIQYQYKVS